MILSFLPGRIFSSDNIPADSIYRINEILIIGNNVTRDEIIIRELTFSVGDSIKVKDIAENFEKSRENLINTSLFNFVQLISDSSGEELFIRIVLTERWYIWPVVLFEHADRNLPAWIKNPDFEKLNYGMQLNWNNFRGRRELIELKARFGYKEQFAVSYFKPNIDKNQKHGLSFSIDKFRQHEVTLRSIANEPEYIQSDSNYIFESISPLIGYYNRPGLYFSQDLYVTYTNLKFRNSEFRNDFLGISEGNSQDFITIGYSATYEFRDSWIYPLDGYMFNVRLARRGIGLLDDFKFPKTYLILIGNYNKPLSKSIFWGTAAKARITKNEFLPYYFREGLGFSTYLRGFEYYLIDGNSYFLSVNNLKYALLRNVNHTIKWIPWEQFNKIHFSVYSGAFFDFAYVQGRIYENEENNLVNKLLFSGGLSVDFVSYYDQVLRLEFTVNSLGDPGLYLHVEMPFTRW